jgi:hypothetical protein
MHLIKSVVRETGVATSPALPRTAAAVLGNRHTAALRSFAAVARANVKRSKRLTVCFGILSLTSALFGCAAYREYKECGYAGCPGDAKITAEVKQALARHPDLGGTDMVYVETINHVVYLTGQVDSGLQREAAESVSRKASGVTQVVDNISISK